jgi:threonylcarbamoyladenosine tRNA methylthiotransferase MtaB
MTDYNVFENKTAAYFTLGCKLNFAETSTIGKMLENNGIRQAGKGEIADVCVINTCSVTEQADRKCRQLIRRVHKLYPNAIVIVTGCYAQLKPDEIASIRGVDFVLGTAQKFDVLYYLNQKLCKQDASKVITSPIADLQHFTPSCQAGNRTRYFLKVQDGCDYCCSYCTIPLARGRSRNGSINSIVEQATHAARDGAKEIVLTGVNIGDFGKSTGETFFNLLNALDGVEGVERYRISSVEPNLITDEIVHFMANSTKFVPHFHIPLQSGSDHVLKLMKRRYNTELFRRKILEIKQLMPHAFIGVDVIVGIHGETNEYFNDCQQFLEDLSVSQLHVFCYSERPDTQAINITPVVDAATKHQRSKILIELSERKLKDFYQSQLGQTANVLFEHTRKGKLMYGFTENYVKTEAPYDESKINRLSRVRLDSWNNNKSALTVTFLDT